MGQTRVSCNPFLDYRCEAFEIVYRRVGFFEEFVGARGFRLKFDLKCLSRIYTVIEYYMHAYMYPVYIMYMCICLRDIIA